MAWPLSNPWRHRVAVVLTASVLTVSPRAFAQPSADAKVSLADGDKAAKAKDWASAVRLYDAANKASPSAEALDGLANAHLNGGAFGDAFTAYSEWLEKYGPKAPAAKKKAAEARLKELEAKTGALTIVVNEPGATVTVDDKPVGTSPILGPVRATVGARRVKVTKDGFAPFEQPTNVASGTGNPTLQVTLVSTSTKGKVVVKEKAGKAVRISVDGVDMGDAPWTGELDPGPHDIGLRGTGLVAAPQKITVEKGKTQEIELVASSNATPVKIATSDNKGLIYLDGKLVGEGGFSADVPAGPHKLRITREGYDPFEEDIVFKDKEPFARTVTLKISSKIETGAVVDVERLEGVYGGFSLLGMVTPGGTNSSIEVDCDNKAKITTLASCDTPGGLGAGFGGFIGYHWDPVGIELMLAGQYDQRTLKNDYNAANTDPGFGPDPARFESFNVRRLAGMGAARVRLTFQTSKLRFSFAAGAGVVRRVIFLERTTTSKDGQNLRDLYVADGEGYWSPVVSIDPSLSYRLTKGVALSLGVQVLFDAPATFLNGNENPKSKAEAGHALRRPNEPGRGLATPSYELASDMQVFIGPYLGMMFGP